jgi:hypothetical protein
MTDSTRLPLRWLIVATGLAIGVGIGAGVGLAFKVLGEPACIRELRERMDEQSAMIEQQRLLLESLGGAINNLHSNRAIRDSSRGCLTLADLRAELGKGSQVLPSPAAEPKDRVDVRTGEAAKQEAGRIVESAVSAGHWTEQDAAQFRSLLGSMTASQRDEAQSVLFKALNEHQLPYARHGAF